MNKFSFLKAYVSPFKRPIPKLYFGTVALSTPYFYPRKWVNISKEQVKEKTLEQVKKLIDAGKIPTTKIIDELYKTNSRYKTAVPKKIGFDIVGLGWKTKWSDTDYRFEWGPIWSFVLFKWQLAITFETPAEHHYWEAWLFYERNTDKTKSIRERVDQCKKEYPLVYTSHFGNGKEETIDYYDKILKYKYLINIKPIYERETKKRR